MGAGAKGHARVNADGQPPAGGRFQPGRHDDQALANRDRVIVLLPGFHPVDFLDRLELWLRQRRSLAICDAGEVPQALQDALAGLFQALIHQQVAAHAQRPHRLPALIFWPRRHRRRLDHHPIGNIARQNLGHGLGQFTIYDKGDLQPGLFAHPPSASFSQSKKLRSAG